MKKKLYILLLLLGFSTTGCNDWLTIQPETMLIKDEMFTSQGGYRDALMGIYISMRDLYNYDKDLISGTVEHLACQWEVNKKSTEEYLNLHDYSYEGVDVNIEGIFEKLYKMIANTNLLIEYLRRPEAEILDAISKRLYLGQALAMRAFFHFDLIRLWGPAPLHASDGKAYLPYAENLQVDPFKYDSYAAYMVKLKRDLDEAEKLLTEKDEVSYMIQSPKQFNYFAVLAMKARWHLWMTGEENKVEAIRYATLLKENKKFVLGTYNHIASGDLSLKKEHIFQLQYLSSKALAPFNYPDYVTNDLFEKSASDIRVAQWKLKEITGKEDPKMIIAKYNIPAPEEGKPTPEGTVPLIRIAEIWLMLIECLPLEEANQLYEEFCIKREIMYKPMQSENERKETLIREYRKEFTAEGVLFYAYKRWATVKMPRCRIGLEPRHYVLPLPLREIDINR